MTKILLVEDDPFISEIYTKKFETSGFEVASALTGREVLKKVLEATYDLILLDMVIPEVSGMEVLKELRTNKEYNPDLKVVVFSNLSGPQERQDALAAGANGFISKTDFTPSEVVNEVRRYLDQFTSQAKHAESQPVVDTSAVPAVSLEDTFPEPGTEKRILFIEDEPVFVEMFGKALRDLGYAIVTERDGRGGLDRALTGNFDLVITDHHLPSMDGKAIIEALKQDERTKDLPVFLLTASLEEAEVAALQASGVVKRAFLKTKVMPSELAMVVKGVFAGHSS